MLDYTRERHGTESAQKVYRAILYRSTIARAMLESDEDTTIQLFSSSVDVERLAQKSKKKKANLKRLYDKVIELIGSSALADDFRQQKLEDLASFR